ncbi:hypothetical protein WOLCODRAFT_164397 [Wolfiporia cocos MD-104 SS10]|uniref:Alpha-ketoglutarate-dependent dioxygenase AlkB-like domain-containing protein n=1 Tax=Wolfiporia cocos (strain MD-104) TaxID=742152 RepID=A0A2H3JMG2_WOLCO|nr:hypothetical protein WOLCODRAFT_164397 [Wolfiporia cocos MD-104 SS10]
MRAPTSWGDAELLQDEPFLSEFLVRANAAGSRIRINDADWNDRIVKEVISQDAASLNQSRSTRAAEEWLRLAFAPSRDEDPAIQATKVPADEGFVAFVHFYWLLYQKDRDGARRFLRKERRQRNLWHEVPDRPSETLPVQVAPPTHANDSDALHHRTNIQPKLPSSLSGGRRRAKRARTDGNKEDVYDAEESQSEDDPPYQSSMSIPRLRDPKSRSGQGGGATLSGVEVATASFASSFDELFKRPIDDEDSNASAKRKAASSLATSSSSQSQVNTSQTLDAQNDADGETLSSLSELTDSAPEDNHPVASPPGQTEVLTSSRSFGLRPQRAASNSVRLRMMMERENAYRAEARRQPYANLVMPENKLASNRHESSKNDAFGTAKFADVPKGIPKTSKEPQRSVYVSTSPFGTIEAAESHVTPSLRPTESTHVDSCTTGPPSSTTDPPSQQPQPEGVEQMPAKKKVTAKKPARYAEPVTAKKPMQYAQASTGKKPTKYSNKASDAKLPDRPTKRSRSNKGELDAHYSQKVAHLPAVIGETVNASQSVRIDATNPPLGHVASPVVEHDVSGVPIKSSARPEEKKRSRASFEATSVPQEAEHIVDQQAKRLTIKLPNRPLRSKQGAPTSTTVAKSVGVGRLSSLQDADMVIRGASSDALERVLHDPKQYSSEDWPSQDEEDGQDVLPDSSDEEPLQDMAQQQRHRKPDVIDIPTQYPALEKGYSSQSFPPLSAAAYVEPRQDPTVAKPQLHTIPPIWAQSRQEVCDAFDWFRSYQGGVYFMKDMVKGYLLSAFSSSRDIFAHGGRLIISHGGGKAESLHTKDGQITSQEADDQLSEDKSVRALMNTYATGRPLALLIDDRYSLFPYDLAADNYTYVVLGFYRIVHTWAEQQVAQNTRGYVVRYKFAFQWCEEQGNPWWIHVPAPAPTEDIAGIDSDPVMFPSTTPSKPLACHSSSSNTGKVAYQCRICGTASPMIYAQHWLCLRPKCAAFWRTQDGRAPSTVLDYAADFLQLLPFPLERIGDIRPPLPVTDEPSGVTTNRIFCKGWHCRKCGRLSCRYKWEFWECKHCGATHHIPGRVRDPKEFWGQKDPLFMHHSISDGSGIIVPAMQYFKIGKAYAYFQTYILPHSWGRIHLIAGVPLTNGEANSIFKEYQEAAASGDLPFRRWPLRSHKCRGTLLTNYFSQNCGEPYQYIGATDNTIPWEMAPSAVCRARALIEQRMFDALRMKPGFNEVLSAAYMEKQKMAFHSDSERGLGPVVASLSLGSAAYMHFRLHNQYDSIKGKGTRRTALTLYLRHGDVLVMEGDGVQKYYEHTVIPINFRIAATARCINSQGN